MKPLPTQAYLKATLDYDPETGGSAEILWGVCAGWENVTIQGSNSEHLSNTTDSSWSYDTLVSHVESIGGPPPGGEKIIYGGVHIEKYVIPAGTVLISHCHGYDHPSILASGTGELWTPEGIQQLKGPTEVKIGKGVKHAFAAATDVTWYCLKPLIVGG